eukprot:scaffold77328_cov22-Cyclotella_meneghiniana.AAC.4
MSKQRCKQKNTSRRIVAEKKKRQECSGERDGSAGKHVTNNITYNINNMGATFTFNSACGKFCFGEPSSNDGKFPIAIEYFATRSSKSMASRNT